LQQHQQSSLFVQQFQEVVDEKSSTGRTSITMQAAAWLASVASVSSLLLLPPPLVRWDALLSVEKSLRLFRPATL